MTREIFTPAPIYTIATAGPYPITHPYQVAAEIACTIFQGTAIVELVNGTDFTVAPNGSETTGDVTLSAAIFAAYTGASLRIRRMTTADQGWAGQTARERGLEAQLDALTQRMQEIDEAIARSIKIPEGAIGELPLDYGGTWLGFDAGQTLIAATGAVGLPTSAYMATLLGAADAPAARLALGAPGKTTDESITGGWTFAGDGAKTPKSQGATAGFGWMQTGAAADFGAWRAHVTADGIYHIDPMPDDLSTYLGEGLAIARNTTGVTGYSFNIQGALAAVIEAAGVTVLSAQAILTREKGDTLYSSTKAAAVVISAGIIAYASEGMIRVDTEGLAATDDLQLTTLASEGQMLTLMQEGNSRIVTIKNGVVGPGFSGFKLLGGVDFAFTSYKDTITFRCGVGRNWYEISRSVN